MKNAITVPTEKLLDSITTCRRFMSPRQVATMLSLMRGEEGQFFADKFIEMADRFTSMPKTYDQDGAGENAVAHLHYFSGGGDWYITERDVETPDEPGQHQAFGVANLGWGPSLGYISLVELARAGVEIDLHFAPRKLSEIPKAKGGD